MAPSDDLKSHAASSHDFYALLSLPPTAAEAEIRRAYRRTALKYHPDKLTNPTSADIDKFHLLQIAYDVLSDPSIRQLYDNAREARERKKRETEMLEGVRRKMKEDLEARERGVKRTWTGVPMQGNLGVDDNAEEKLEQEIKRLAEDGRRRRREKEELLRREVLEEEERLELEKGERERAAQRESRARHPNVGGTSVPEIDRTVKVRWPREGAGLELDKGRLESLFSVFGKVDSAFTLKDKRQRVGEKKERKTMATGVIVFASIVGAHAAVGDYKHQKGKDWEIIESVYWASNKEPDFHRPSACLHQQEEQTRSTAPTSISATKSRDKFNFPGLNTSSSPAKEEHGLKKTPSFASFSPAEFKGPNGSSSTGHFGLGPNSPSLEELTMIRLKNAERKKLEEQIRKEDELLPLQQEEKSREFGVLSGSKT
ncbi:cell cycle control protein [Histoplasma ohiense]|nr:cell cycle control protein [Histoplasma ohiense (nom. inval.)]